MLGNHGACFECAHEHAVGDRCLSFHYQPSLWEEIVSSVAGARRLDFQSARLSPVPALAPLTADIQTMMLARREDLEAAVLDVAAAVLNADSDLRMPSPSVSRLDERRVTDAIRIINDSEGEVDSDALTIAALSHLVGMSSYHFLRVFRRIVGSTPHQYIIRQRMHRAATRLLESTVSVSDIAFGAGFGDLSTFNRQFKRLFGVTPRQYRTNRAPGPPKPG